MACKWKYWCPKECGKTVTAHHTRGVKYDYKCNDCGGTFTKEEIMKV